MSPVNIIVMGDNSEDLLIYEKPSAESNDGRNLKENYQLYPHFDGKLCTGGTYQNALIVQQLLSNGKKPIDHNIISIEDDTQYISLSHLHNYPKKTYEGDGLSNRGHVLRISKFEFYSKSPAFCELIGGTSSQKTGRPKNGNDINLGTAGNKHIHFSVKEFIDSSQHLKIVGKKNSEAPSDYLLIHDLGNSFRNNPAFKYDQKSNTGSISRELVKIQPVDQLGLVVLKLFAPLSHYEENALWKYYLKDLEKKLVIITTIQDLRLCGAKISKALSWERTTEDFIREIKYNPQLSILSKCKCLIVKIGFEGALVYFPDSSKLSLIFNPSEMEGSFEENNEGEILAKTTLFSSVIFFYLLDFVFSSKQSIEKIDPSEINIKLHVAIQKALEILRYTHQCGYRQVSINKKPPTIEEIQDQLKYTVEQKLIKGKDNCPYRTLKVKQSSTETQIFSCFDLQKEVFDQIREESPAIRNWTIISKSKKGNYGTIAYNYVKSGGFLDDRNMALPFPIYRMGRLLTVDRTEIESYQNVRKLIKEYLRNTSIKSPLSIAVFGPPGSGKSFGIKEMVKTFNEKSIRDQTYNLSQFSSPDDLRKAFHRVRDCSFKGKIPLVFFDEFDTPHGGTDLGWLKHFLMPMQDGMFMDAEIPRPIGRAIFIFAGGVHPTYSDFCGSGIHESEKQDWVKSFNADKKPDFISRLRGHIDLIGCNPCNGNQVTDQIYKIRRALLLRSFLEENGNHLFKNGKLNIDRHLLRSFIKIDRYRHGNRSMKAIIEMSNLGATKRFEPASLPGENQLDMHVDAKKFEDLLLRDNRYEAVKKSIADEIDLAQNNWLKLYKENEKENEKEFISLFVEAIPGIFNEINYSLIKESGEKSSKKDYQFDKDKFRLVVDGRSSDKEEHGQDGTKSDIIKLFYNHPNSIVVDRLCYLEKLLDRHGFSLYPI